MHANARESRQERNLCSWTYAVPEIVMSGSCNDQVVSSPNGPFERGELFRIAAIRSEILH